MIDCIIGQQKVFDYIGHEEKIDLIPGIYRITLFGASGGGHAVARWPNSRYGSIGGPGGTTVATLKTIIPLTLFAHIGSAGTYGSWRPGGYNGGGVSGNSSCGSGGGATDLRFISGLWNDLESLKSRILVAGGGGGADNYTGEGPGGNDDGSGGAGGGSLPKALILMVGFILVMLAHKPLDLHLVMDKMVLLPIQVVEAVVGMEDIALFTIMVALAVVLLTLLDIQIVILCTISHISKGFPLKMYQ